MLPFGWYQKLPLLMLSILSCEITIISVVCYVPLCSPCRFDGDCLRLATFRQWFNLHQLIGWYRRERRWSQTYRVAIWGPQGIAMSSVAHSHPNIPFHTDNHVNHDIYKHRAAPPHWIMEVQLPFSLMIRTEILLSCNNYHTLSTFGVLVIRAAVSMFFIELYCNK